MFVLSLFALPVLNCNLWAQGLLVLQYLPCSSEPLWHIHSSSKISTGFDSVVLLHWNRLRSWQQTPTGEAPRMVMQGLRKCLWDQVLPLPSPSISPGAQRYKDTFPNTTHSLCSSHISLFTENGAHDPRRVGSLRHLLKGLFKSPNLSLWCAAKLTTSSRSAPAPVPCPRFQDQLCCSRDSPDC